MYRQRLIDMFVRMVEAKNLDLVPVFYDPDLLIYTNGQVQDYDAFHAGHARVYPTEITYSVRYDEQAWVEGPDGVAGRIWITTARPDEDAVEMEVMLVARYRGERIWRLWELTWPDWTQVKALENY